MEYVRGCERMGCVPFLKFGSAHLFSEDKYAPGETSRWKHVSARFPALYKALLAEPDEAVRSSMFKTAVHLAG